MPRGRAREEKIRDVCASDKQHKGNRAEQDEQRRFHVADDFLVKRIDHGSDPGVVLRILLGKARPTRFGPRQSPKEGNGPLWASTRPTVYLSRWSASARPITPGSLRRRRLKSFSLSTATFVPGLSSSGTKLRPRMGRTPNKSKRFAETRRPSRRSGSPTPVRLKLRSANAAIPSKSVFCFCQSRKLAADGVLFRNPSWVAFSQITTSWLGFL